jgi:spermidine synthase
VLDLLEGITTTTSSLAFIRFCPVIRSLRTPVQLPDSFSLAFSHTTLYLSCDFESCCYSTLEFRFVKLFQELFSEKNCRMLPQDVLLRNGGVFDILGAMPNRKMILGAVLLKGFSAVIIQTLLIRELLIVFYGNELTFGIILATWLLSGAVGASWGGASLRLSASPLKGYVLLQLFLSVCSPLALALVRTSKTILHVSFGEALALGPIIAITACSIAGAAFADGALFNLAFRLLSKSSREEGPSFAKVYAWESLGIICGGIVLPFVLLSRFHSFEIILSVATLNLLSANLLLGKNARRLPRVTLALCFLMSLAALYSADRLQEKTLKIQWQNNDLVAYKNSVYGNIAAVRRLDQSTVYYDGLPTISVPSPETYFTEDFVHLPLLSAPESKNILFIGTAVGGLIKEALRYPVQKIVYVEIDAALIKVLRSLKDPGTDAELNDAKVRVVFQDARAYLRTTPEKFDAVFINTGLPTSLALNRYATLEFFEEVKNVLSGQGIAVFKTAGSLTYLSPQLRHINAQTLNTLSRVFEQIQIIPGDGFNMFITSTKKQDFNPYTLALRLKQYHIKSYLMNPTYLQLRLQKPYLDWFLTNIRADLKTRAINEDTRPIALYEGLSLTYAQFSKKIPGLFSGFEKIKPRGLALGIIFFFILWRFILKKTRQKRALVFDVTVLTTGFFSMAIQITVILLFQSLLGSLFQGLALLTASFMAGGSCGAWIARKKMRQLSDIKRCAALEIYVPSAIIGLVLATIAVFKYSGAAAGATQGLFALTSLSAGLFVGLELPVVFELYVRTAQPFRRETSRTAGLLYGLDLTGACLGALVTPLVLIPACGIIPTILILLLMKAANARNIFILADR